MLEAHFQGEMAVRYGFCPCGAPLRVMAWTDGDTIQMDTVCSTGGS